MHLKIILFLIVIAKGMTQDFEEMKEINEIHEPHNHPHGTPLNVMQFTSNHSITVDYDAIDNLLTNVEVADRKMIAISIIGAFRKGKSFFLDYCLRFMYANYKSINYMNNPLENTSNWIGSHDAPLNGFSWKAGPHRHTSGVVIWSDIFLHEINLKDNKTEKLAIVFMDTQGLFDQKTSAADNSRIFALGTLISSLQIFNLNDVIQENQLEYLQMATDYAKFVTDNSKDTSSKPFQSLLFLMRDWQSDFQYPLGNLGGSQYLDEVLRIKDDQSAELKKVRNYIRTSFESIDCFLLPHPGLEVVNDRDYDGRFSRLNPKFQTHLKLLIEWILNPNDIQKKKKKVLTAEVTGKAFNEYVKDYFKAFQNPETPKILSIYEATIDRQFSNAVEQTLGFYKEGLRRFEPDYSVENFTEKLVELHDKAKKFVLLRYDSDKKMGSLEHEQKYRKQLEQAIDDYYNEWFNSTMETYNGVVNLKKESEQEKQLIQDEADAKFLTANETLQNEKLELQNKMEERERQIALDMALKEEEKKAEIQKIQNEMTEHRKQSESRMNQLMQQQQVENERIQAEAEERVRKTKEEIMKLKEEQQAKKAAFEEQLKADRELRMAEMQKEAEERKEQRRFEAEKLEREDALRREEMQALRDKMDQESQERKAQLAKEEARRADERKEREERRRSEEIMLQQQIAQREKDRAVQRAEFEQQLLALQRASGSRMSLNINIMIFACFLYLAHKLW